MSFVVVIPARYSSSRLPGKPLKDLCGKTMIARVADKALASGADAVYVATDSELVADAVRIDGVEVVMTAKEHNSGTERLAEVARVRNFADDTIVVNVQGDEPLMPPVLISQVAQLLEDSDAPMATLSVPITEYDEIFNPNAVKVVTDETGNALYFSRAPIPYERDNFTKKPGVFENIHFRHLGIYAYRAGFLQKFVSWKSSALENFEKLEQLRVLSHGEKIRVAVAEVVPPAGIDTQEDLEKVVAYLGEHPEA